MSACPQSNGFGRPISCVPMVAEGHRRPGRGQVQIPEPGHCHERPGEPSIERRPREGRDARRLDEPVEALVIRGEALVMRSIARLVHVEAGHDEARPSRLPPHPARRLDVLARRLGLAGDDHQPEPVDIDPDRDHVAREENVDVAFAPVGPREAGFRFRDPSRGLAARELDRLHLDEPIPEPGMLPGETDGPFVFDRSRPGAHLVLDEPPHSPELSQTVEVPGERHVGIGRLIFRTLRVVDLVRRGQKSDVAATQDVLHRAQRSQGAATPT
jgi:hypothetical protein